jgi:hypothetical protein
MVSLWACKRRRSVAQLRNGNGDNCTLSQRGKVLMLSPGGDAALVQVNQ